MKDYKTLAIRYLQMNKRRVAVTVAGVAVAVTVLYVMLNLGWSYLLHYRDELRKEDDYEIVLFTGSKEKAQQIIADTRVKEAYLGNYFLNDYGEENDRLYSNALYINTKNPYKMKGILEGLKSDYEVEGETNKRIALTYFNGGTANMLFVITILVLLISYIFAIFGVGIIRNSIQLSTLEQIKDYGNLRCIGASKRQLKTFIYLQGAMIEIAGIILGVVIGGAVSYIIGCFARFTAGFHFLPVFPIAIAFLGDLYFAMGENCKLVVGMSPVSALRGEYRIKKEKIKARKSGLVGRLLGVEGDYAYKNIMRNPGRFVRTVFAIGIGIAALIAGVGLSENVKMVVEQAKDMSGYYQVYVESSSALWDVDREAGANLPSMDLMEEFSKASGVEAVKCIYSSNLMLADDGMGSHVTEEYRKYSLIGWQFSDLCEMHENNKNNDDYYVESAYFQTSCYGYDSEDYNRLEKSLVEGTMKLSDKGLLLVNGQTFLAEDEESETLGNQFFDVEMTDYKVGDTVKIVNPQKLEEVLEERITPLMKQYRKLDDGSYEQMEMDRDIRKTFYECYKELVAAGDYELYTIEGIVNKDENHMTDQPYFVVPLDKFYEMTGKGKGDITGMQWHIDRYPLLENLSEYSIFEGGDYFYEDYYVSLMELIKQFRFVLYGVMLFVLFVVSMSGFNIINTTASNLHLRRKEFAQLRVIGVSNKRLIKIVLLEGVIAALVADIVGIAFGCGIGYLVGWYIFMLTGIRYQLPVLSILLGILLSFTLLVGSVYFPLKGQKQDMAADLTASGE